MLGVGLRFGAAAIQLQLTRAAHWPDPPGGGNKRDATIDSSLLEVPEDAQALIGGGASRDAKELASQG